MPFAITSYEAAWLLPFVLPVCLWVIWSDLSAMRIPNNAVLMLAGIFVVIGFFVIPTETYLWRLVAMAVMLVAGIVANAAGLMGAGDSKFIAAAAPYVALGDLRIILFIFTANLLACFTAHRIAKHSPLRRLAPHWQSWDRGRKFPMGFSLGSTLLVYLALGIRLGS